MKTLKFKDEIELLDEKQVKEMAAEGDIATLVLHIDETDENRFCDAAEALEARDEYVENAKGDHDSPEVAEAFFWEATSVSRLNNYIECSLAGADAFNCVDKIVDAKTGYAVLFQEELEPELDDREELEKYMQKAFPGVAEKAVLHWKNGWNMVEKRGETDADCICAAVSDDIFADDDKDWLDRTGYITQGICYDSAFWRIGWHVWGASALYC